MRDRRLLLLRDLETWMAWVRVGGVVFAALEIGVFTAHFPPGYKTAGWIITAVFAIGALALFWLAMDARPEWRAALGFSALTFDTIVIAAYSTVFSYEYGNQTHWALVIAVVEAALRYGLWGGAGLSLALVPYYAFLEWWRAHKFGPPGFYSDRVSFPAGVTLFIGLIVGWLVHHLEAEAKLSAERAAEAERLRDALGQRVDTLEAANRCARALASSLNVEEAFGAFIRELSGLIPFDRTAIVLVDGDRATTMATAGRGARKVFPPGYVGTMRGSVLERALASEVVVRGNLAETAFPEDQALVDLGLRSELVAPLLIGARPIGMLSVARARVDAFTAEETELLALLGRLVANAVQNLRAYEAERQTVEELRRLSALRADFVSLVSHELRSPMAAVIGAARTLQDRWRTLQPDQREAFLALIADETARLAVLIGDVLDTSRIEAGTFSYSFGQFDLDRLIEDAVTAATVRQDAVRVRATVAAPMPRIRGDAERLRQVLGNLIDNAVKYSPEGDEVLVTAQQEDGVVRIAVADHGPGIAPDQQRLIFEKFGRAVVPGGSKPGSGLGLFIARSIAEAHGGSLDVVSQPNAGATFTLTLPLES
ncbi:MAG TPA: ATP-binding protein [Gaiellaceae bacterium]|nr:ATP-binding protein [Gaiellaceae bacterium]